MFRVGGLVGVCWCAGRGFCRTGRGSHHVRSRCRSIGRRWFGRGGGGWFGGVPGRGGVRRRVVDRSAGSTVAGGLGGGRWRTGWHTMNRGDASGGGERCAACTLFYAEGVTRPRGASATDRAPRGGGVGPHPPGLTPRESSVTNRMGCAGGVTSQTIHDGPEPSEAGFRHGRFTRDPNRRGWVSSQTIHDGSGPRGERPTRPAACRPVEQTADRPTPPTNPTDQPRRPTGAPADRPADRKPHPCGRPIRKAIGQVPSSSTNQPS